MQLKYIHPKAGNPLIICLASLVPMWRAVNRIYRLGANIVSQSGIAAPARSEWDEEQDDGVFTGESGRGQSLTAKYPNNGPALIDEAHHFRNSAAKLRYKPSPMLAAHRGYGRFRANPASETAPGRRYRAGRGAPLRSRGVRLMDPRPVAAAPETGENGSMLVSS